MSWWSGCVLKIHLPPTITAQKINTILSPAPSPHMSDFIAGRKWRLFGEENKQWRNTLQLHPSLLRQHNISPVARVVCGCRPLPGNSVETRIQIPTRFFCSICINFPSEINFLSFVIWHSLSEINMESFEILENVMATVALTKKN